VTKEHWFFGVGPAGYAAYYMTYFPDEAMATHNTYLDILSQTGVVGFVLFISFFISLGVILWRLWQKTRGRGGFIEAFSVAVFGGYFGTIVAMVLGDWIVPFVYTQTIAGFDYASYTWVMLGAAVALYQSKIS
jgi:O-antigen ligase